MLDTLFIFAALFQGCALAYALWMAITSHYRTAWVLLSIAFTGQLITRLLRLGHVLTIAPTTLSTANSLVVSALLLIAMISIKRIYEARRAADEQLLESENRYRSVVNSLTEAIVIVDHSGITACNPATETIFGLPSDQIVGRSPESLDWRALRDDGSPLPREEIATTIALKTGKSTPPTVIGALRPDGSRAWFSATAHPLFKPGQAEPYAAVASFVDITQRRNFERDLLQAKEAAEQANRAKDQFLAVLSHELRTPLTPVLATAHSLLHDPALPLDFRSDLELLRRNVELEARLIDDLLDLTRISKGKLQLDVEPVNLHDVIAHVLQICAADITAKQLAVSTDLQAAVPWIPGDPARLRQVVWNVLKNAIKFTPAGGTILLRTAGVERLDFSITDNGRGIAPELLPLLFNAFEQGDAAVSRQFGGLGLGLAISKAIVELHGGRIWAESPGRGLGATFVVEFPRLSQPASHGPAAPAAATTRRIHILLVEDHADTSRIMTRLLSTLGHTVSTAGTVADALAAIERAPFDLLISDIGLPDGSGVDLLRALRRSSAIPAIALSGFGMEDDVRKSKEAGFSAHLVKPIDFHLLARTIQQIAPAPA